MLSFVHDGATDTSDMVIRAALDFPGNPTASVRLAVGVPPGFHGNRGPGVAIPANASVQP